MKAPRATATCAECSVTASPQSTGRRRMDKRPEERQRGANERRVTPCSVHIYRESTAMARAVDRYCDESESPGDAPLRRSAAAACASDLPLLICALRTASSMSCRDELSRANSASVIRWNAAGLELLSSSTVDHSSSCHAARVRGRRQEKPRPQARGEVTTVNDRAK